MRTRRLPGLIFVTSLLHVHILPSYSKAITLSGFVGDLIQVLTGKNPNQATVTTGPGNTQRSDQAYPQITGTGLWSASPSTTVVTTVATPTLPATNSTSHQQQGRIEANSQIAGQTIGIIVGTVISTILLTIIIVCIVWKLKTRREKNRRNKTTESSISRSGNLEMNQAGDLRHPTSARDKKPLKTVARVCPVFQSDDKYNKRTHATGHYNYIDINSSVLRSSHTAFKSPTATSPAMTDSQYSTAVETVTEKTDGTYSCLRNVNASFQNPYNKLDQDMHVTTNQPLPVSQEAIQTVSCHVDTQYSRIDLTNQHTPLGEAQQISTSE